MLPASSTAPCASHHRDSGSAAFERRSAGHPQEVALLYKRSLYSRATSCGWSALRQHLLELVNNHFPGSHFRRPLHVLGQVLLHPARGCARRLFGAAAVMEEAEGDDGVVARVHQVVGHEARRLFDERHEALFGKAYNLIQIADILDAIASDYGIHGIAASFLVCCPQENTHF